LLSVEAAHNSLGVLFYQIQGTDEWIDEEKFRRHCDANARYGFEQELEAFEMSTG
jgi:hypothetical protein